MGFDWELLWRWGWGKENRNLPNTHKTCRGERRAMARSLQRTSESMTSHCCCCCELAAELICFCDDRGGNTSPSPPAKCGGWGIGLASHRFSCTRPRRLQVVTCLAPKVPKGLQHYLLIWDPPWGANSRKRTSIFVDYFCRYLQQRWRGQIWQMWGSAGASIAVMSSAHASNRTVEKAWEVPRLSCCNSRSWVWMLAVYSAAAGIQLTRANAIGGEETLFPL